MAALGCIAHTNLDNLKFYLIAANLYSNKQNEWVVTSLIFQVFAIDSWAVGFRELMIIIITMYIQLITKSHLWISRASRGVYPGLEAISSN